MTASVSLAMIVKDEEQTIERVLDSARDVCDEMIVVDTGSSDGTVVLASARGAAVTSFEWIDDFASARNASFAACNCDWILWLDADDVLSEPAREKLLEMKGWLSDGLDVIVAPYHYRIAPDGTVRLKFNRERLVRREAGLRWEGRVHEVIPVPERSLLVPELIVEHRPDPARRALHRERNIRILEAEVADGNPTLRTRLYYANELYDLQRYEEAAVAYRAYLENETNHGAERYWALLYLAEASRVLGDDETLVRAAVDAIAQNASRAEAYVCLGRLHFDRERWAEAVPLFTAATSATNPSAGLGFVRNEDYLYLPWHYLSVCLDRLGRRAEALAAAQRALPGNPEADVVRSNMHWFVDNL